MLMKDDNNFDESLKAQVENFYMYPNERLWHNIQQKLPKRNRMPNARNYGLIVMLLSFGCFFNMLEHNDKKKSSNTNIVTINNATVVTNEMVYTTKNRLIEKNKPTQYKNILTNSVSLDDQYNYTNVKQSMNSRLFRSAVTGNTYLSKHDGTDVNTASSSTVSTLEKMYILNDTQSPIDAKEEKEYDELGYKVYIPNAFSNSVEPALTNNGTIPTLQVLPLHNYSKKDVQQQLLKDVMLSKIKFNKQSLTFPTRKEKHWERSMYIVPVMSSVKLVDNGAYGDVNLLNEYNNLSSRFGIELGTQMHYKIHKSSIAFGIQANVYGNKFTAYKTNEVERAYVVTANANNYRLDSINTILRTIGTSDKSLNLSNKFVTISFPVGFTHQLFTINNHINFYVAGNVAPTIIVNADNYAVTGNVKNYIRATEYVRKWNLNTSANIYLEYKLNAVRFQVGPQVRHQLLNTYIKGYPIKEKSKDFGLRIGIIKSF